MTFGISSNSLFIVIICVLTAVSIVLWTIALRSVLRVLDFVIAQFKTDSGTSLRDVVDRVEVGGRASMELTEAVRGLLLRMETAQGVVADELKAAQARADSVVDGEPGAAADAGIRSEETP